MTNDTASTFGVYVHVPFCAHRCDYCAFATYADRDHLMEEYVTAVIHEIAWARADGLPVATSVFFGGGTPSRLPADAAAAHPRRDPAHRRRRGDRRVQPRGRVARAPPRLPRRRGEPHELRRPVDATGGPADLGRRHGTMAQRSVSRRHRGRLRHLEHGPHHRVARRIARRRRATLDDLLGLEHPPPHISCYVLTPEPGTPLGEDPSRHPDEDDSADAYELVSAMLEEHGYQLGGDLELGQARSRVPTQPRLLGPGRLRRLRLGRALAPSRAAVLERAHARSLHRDGARRARRRSAARRSSTTRTQQLRARLAGAAHGAGRAARGLRLTRRDRRTSSRSRTDA